jgi:hypothetical protein
MEFLWNNAGATPEFRRSTSTTTRPSRAPDKAYLPDPVQVPCDNASANLRRVSGLNGETAWQRLPATMISTAHDLADLPEGLTT